MNKRDTYTGAYSLIFAGVTIFAGAVALIRQDGMAIVAVAFMGLYVLHLLSLRAQARKQPAAARRRVEDDRSAHSEERLVPRAHGAAMRDAPDSEPREDARPVFLSRESGFVREVGDTSITQVREPATEDSGWMVKLSEPDEEPEFLPADSEVPAKPLPAGAEASSEVPIPRKFALGTVAIIHRALDPAQVARVLQEQRKFPKKRFGELAVGMGYITESQLEELLEAQRSGLFRDADIQSARERLGAYRRESSAVV